LNYRTKISKFGGCIHADILYLYPLILGMSVTLQELVKSLKSAPGKLYPLKCDVSKESDVKEAFKWVKSNLGGISILVNNAGVCDFNTLIGG
jgi:NADP+-dependent farnesol dehydrogenase